MVVTRNKKRKAPDVVAKSNKKAPVSKKSKQQEPKTKAKPAPTKTKTPSVPKEKKVEITPVEPCYPLDVDKATVMACGSGELLQLGIDVDTVESPRPRPVSNLSDCRVRWAAAGGGSNAAIIINAKGEREIYTWGCNDKFALGRKTTNHDEQILPATISFPGEDTEVIQITIGDNHMAALDSLGRVYTWGTYRDYEGRHFFKPSRDSDKQPTPELMKELVGKRIVQIASGENVTLALNDKGVIYIWGIYKYNQRISRRSHIQHSYLLPSPVTEKIKFVGVYSGSFSHFGVTKDNKVYGWGLNNYGQLAMDEEIDKVVEPRHLSSLPSDIKIKSMAGGHHHTILLTEDGNIYSWGRGDYGQLGHGNTNNNIVPTAIEVFKNLPEDNRVVQISSGDNHCTAVTQQGDVYTWGFGEMCQLGHGPDQDKLTPTKINNTHEKSILTGKRVLYASGGGQHTIFVTVLKE